MPDPTNPPRPTPEQLAEWRNLCQKTTPGPWRLEESGGEFRQVGAMKAKIVAEYPWKFTKVDAANFAFIVAAREALPLLLARVEQLERALDRELHGWKHADYPTQAELEIVLKGGESEAN